ncbi:MDR family MFS transporter [Mangrovactinospora gilvigrisea]|uniref:MDR family MFS transporter n=1 Tax=Mangrovactinospora gilvigrisea TaxID=1428644 RepID=UPI0009A0D8D8|nr:MDR family MFS transporter [Mangrovactinospora gilvigrisea]
MPESPTAAAPPAAPRNLELTHRQILTILSGLMLGMFLAALDGTVVGTAIRVIADDLHGLSEQAWATTAYLITSTIVTPLYGKLSDLHGRKPYYLIAISVFLAGSLACTFATSMYELAAFRAVQGLGAGGLMSLALAIVADIVPPRDRGKYQGYFMGLFGISSVAGPVVGGFFAGHGHLLGLTGWRWVFLVNVPIGIVALLVVGKVLNLPHTPRDHRIDWPGAVTITVGLVPLLIVAEQGREWGWSSGTSLLCYAIGVVGLIAFVFAERAYGEDALIPIRLFKNSVFSLTTVIGVVIGMGMFGAMLMIPQYLQMVKGYSPTKAGLLMLPLMIGMMGASMGAGQIIARTGRYKVLPIVGAALMLIGMVLFATMSADTALWLVMLYMLVLGAGLGPCMQTLVLAVQNAVPPRDMGVASASSTFFRQMGGTLGTAVFLSILFSEAATKIGSAFARIAPTRAFQAALRDPKVVADPANKPVLDMMKHQGGSGSASGGGVLSDSSFLNHLDPRLARPFKVGFSDSMTVVFVAAAVITAVAFVLLFFVKEIPLRQESGMQARENEAAAAVA